MLIETGTDHVSEIFRTCASEQGRKFSNHALQSQIFILKGFLGLPKILFTLLCALLIVGISSKVTGKTEMVRLIKISVALNYILEFFSLGPSLGKIEKELTPEFRSCYVRWEKETMELAGQLTRIFYNLDTNLNSSSSGASVPTNLIPPQVVVCDLNTFFFNSQLGYL